MYTIKNSPEDFIVNEKPSFVLSDGDYAICKLVKTNVATNTAIEILCSYLSCKRRDLGFAGNKDKVAITTQYVSIKFGSKQKIENFSHELITLEYLGQSKKPISLGDLEGNHFSIVIENCEYIEKKEWFVNYFGEQRFSEHNVAIGKLLLEKKFGDVCALLQDISLYKDALDSVLQNSPNDYINALSKVPQKVLSLFVSAYQSYLWNSVVSQKISQDKNIASESHIEISGMKLAVPKDYLSGELPLLGFETEDVCEEYEDLLTKEGLSQRHFIIPQLAFISAGGSFRSICVRVPDLEIKQTASKTYTISFTLPKGCYATTYIRHLCL
ncbi:MAG: tRNA pseudouridine(13) synthase TruD [Candidatus Woesearchaeota archaeon]